MHEEHLLRDLVEKVNEIARASPDATVLRARIWIGALSHLREEVLRDRWPQAAAGTPASEVELVVEASRDPSDPRAQQVVLTSVDLRDAMPTPPHAESPRRPNEPTSRSPPCA